MSDPFAAIFSPRRGEHIVVPKRLHTQLINGEIAETIEYLYAFVAGSESIPGRSLPWSSSVVHLRDELVDLLYQMFRRRYSDTFIKQVLSRLGQEDSVVFWNKVQEHLELAFGDDAHSQLDGEAEWQLAWLYGILPFLAIADAISSKIDEHWLMGKLTGKQYQQLLDNLGGNGSALVYIRDTPKYVWACLISNWSSISFTKDHEEFIAKHPDDPRSVRLMVEAVRKSFEHIDEI
jgi:hypothetical protein